MDPHARARHLLRQCDALANHSDEPGRITRPYGGTALQRAQDDVAAWMRAAGMEVYRDDIGTLRGRYPGLKATAPALLIGSHLDSVRDAGRYDGPLGILIGIAAVARLADAARHLAFPIEVIAFPDEEGLRFQTTYLGSSALAGVFDPGLLERSDEIGVTLREAIARFGGDPGRLADAALRPGEARGYVEVHIEQGPSLEVANAPVGVVTTISGQTRIQATIIGEAGHAGTVAMALRRDPLPAAAELILEAEAMARSTPDLLATVGMVAVSPGATNVIPGQVTFSLDIRHPDDAIRLAAVATLESRLHEIAGARALAADWRIMRDHAAAPCDPALSERLGAAVLATGLPLVRLPSGAGHDAVVMASCLPVAMLFVRCAGGISHNPAESVAADDVAAAIRVLDRLLDDFANMPA